MKKYAFIIAVSLFCQWAPFMAAQNPGADKSLTWFNKTEGGVSFGVGSFNTNIVNGIQKRIKNDEIVVTFQTINGVKYMNRLSLGVSVGVEKWQNGLFWPIYGYLGYAMKPEGNTLFGNIYLGYGIGTRYSTSFYEQGKGGFALSIGLGYQMRISKKLQFIYEVFYKYQALESTYYRINDVTKDSVVIQVKTAVNYKVPLHFAGFKIGLRFP